jgi:GntR family transcriptional regulator/MocR family aminotransferase
VFPAAARRAPSLRWDFQYNVNVCDRTALRFWHRALRRATAAYDREPGAYDLRRGPSRLSRAIARHLAPARGVRCEPHQVITLGGMQQAFQLAARLLAEPGDTVAVEEPSRLGPKAAFRTNDLRVLPVATDEHGIRTDRLPRDRRVRLLCVAPSSCWPSGAVLPLDRRLRLLEWARQNDAWIVEHDHNSEHGHGGTPVVSVQGLDEDERVIYVGTFSRLLSPEPEIAYAVVPDALAEPFAVAKELESYWCGELEMTALSLFLEAGELDHLLRRLARRLRPLRETLLEAIDALPEGMLSPVRTGTGLHVHAVAPGAPAGEAEDVARRCAEAGVGVFPDTPYRLRRAPAAGFLLGFARMTPEDIREGVARFGEVLARHG